MCNKVILEPFFSFCFYFFGCLNIVVFEPLFLCFFTFHDAQNHNNLSSDFKMCWTAYAKTTPMADMLEA